MEPLADRPDLESAMRRALALATTATVPLGPNPRVGAVVLDAHGDVVGEGYHRGAGTAHAEVDALAAAGERARGGTVVVTLEPCTHTGRTGPCTEALIAAGVARVVYAQDDQSRVASGGADRLRAAGIDVATGLLADQAKAVNRAWSFAHEHRRPFVTWKVGATLDGRVSASDGTSRWITGDAARAQVHDLRAQVDAVVVGTGTVLADDPQLTARDSGGAASGSQPLRVVMGRRDVPATARVRDDSAPTLLTDCTDPAEVLHQLYDRDCQHALLEGGPTLAASFLRAGLVDGAVVYVAPLLLGSGLPMVADLGIATLADARRLTVTDVARVGDDVRITLTPVTEV